MAIFYIQYSHTIPSTDLTMITPSTSTGSPDCPVQSQSCQRLLNSFANRSNDFESRKRSVSEFCSSVCSDLVQQRPECVAEGSFELDLSMTFCTQRPDGELCGVIIHREPAISLQNILVADCSSPGINCTNKSNSCITNSQAYANYIGCCAREFILARLLRLACQQVLQISSSCQGEHAA